MKRILTIALAAPLVISGTVFAANDKPKKEHKVTICHATSSVTNPFVRIVVDEHATKGHFDNNGTPLSGHEDDLLFTGEVSCPKGEQPPVDEPEEPETPTQPQTPPVVTSNPQKPSNPSVPENPGIVDQSFGK